MRYFLVTEPQQNAKNEKTNCLQMPETSRSNGNTTVLKILLMILSKGLQVILMGLAQTYKNDERFRIPVFM